MNKRIKVTSLTAAALASIILAGANVNNVKADVTADNATTAKAQTPEDQAKANITSAQNDVDTAESNVSSASSNLDKAKGDAAKPDKAYADQSKVVDSAKKNAAAKNKALQSANAKKADAEKLANEAKKPGAIDAAKKAVSDKKSDIANKQKAVNAAQAKTPAAQKAVNDAKSDLAAKQNDLKNKQNAKADADKKVTDADNALHNTNFDQVKDNLNKANAAVSKDAADLNNIANIIKNNHTKVESTKKLASDAEDAKNAASVVKNNAQANYNTKKAASDKANAAVNSKNAELAKSQKQLDQIKDLSKNEIVIPDLDTYKQAFKDYYDDKELTQEQKDYLAQARANNVYKSSEADQNEIVDTNNMTDAQSKELSLFVADLTTKLRSQFGLNADKVTNGSLGFAKNVAKYYVEDAKSGNYDPSSENMWHDEGALNKALKNITGDGANALDTECAGTGFGTQVSMDDLKQQAYQVMLSMIFPDGNGITSEGAAPTYEFGHAAGLIGLEENSNIESLDSKQALKQDRIDSLNRDIKNDQDAVKEAEKRLEDTKKGGEADLIKDAQDQYDSYMQTLKDDEAELQKVKSDSKNPSQGDISAIITPNGNGSFMIHYLRSASDNKVYDNTEAPSYEKQAANVQKQINVINNSLSDLKAKATSLNNATSAAKTALDNASANLTSKQNALNKAKTNYQAAQNALQDAIQEEKNLQSKQKEDLATQKQVQASFEAFQGTHQQLVSRYNAALQNQKAAEQAVKNAKTAVATAQNTLKNAEKAQSNLNQDIANKKQAVKEAQTQLTQLQNRELALENAPQILATATTAQEKAQKAYNDAKKQADEAEAALKKLQPAKDEADKKVSDAQSEYDSAVAELSAAKEKLANAKASLEKIQKDQAKIEESHKKSTKKNHKSNKSTKKTSYKRIRLTHNAFVYDKHGKAIRKGLHFKLIRKGKQIKALKHAKVVTIKGQKFYQIGKNEFVKVKNTKFKTRRVHFKARVKGSGRTYSRAGKYNKHHVSTRKTYTFDEKVRKHGRTYYKISGKNLWIPASKLSLKK